ncbi:DUF4334 domain-containing protein [Gordonia humi]|uniref:DUF4334 domain-containing protein n=1 Tax=Gordonia humi TaxID=686429 RepID=A0A840ETG1_9ACTN|nr:DUF4334 domain-containing protein [Gordonia humi]MBB4133624.1 hypothetical protein [Gordonia humi]
MSLTVPQLQSGLTSDAACRLFDSLEPVTADFMIGQWHGSEAPTGHPLDGLLAVSGWYGKRFDGPDEVHPLLFGTPGDLYPVNPGAVPMGLLNSLGTRMPRPKIPGVTTAFKAVKTTRYRARLRRVDYRGTVSAAMVYDQLPIIDHFRRLDDDAVLGAMDLRDSPRPYFFLLERD